MRCPEMRALGALCLLLAGCQAVGPDYAGPPASTAAANAHYPSASALTTADTGVAAAADPAWWRGFRDPALDALVTQALAANYDLAIATTNIEAARASLAEVSTRRRPAVDAQASVQGRRDAVALNPKFLRLDRLPATPSSTFGLNLAWEIDLFGRVRRSIEAAAAELGSLEAVRHGVQVALLADVGRAYLDLRGNQRRLDVAEGNVRVQQQTLELVLLLNREGAATDLDVARARTQLLTSQATIPRLEAAVTNALNRLTTLTAQAPGALDATLRPRQPLPAVPAGVASGEPVDLLRRRPDILAAERALAAATARIGVATADLFPTLSLAGRGGIAAAHFSDLVSTGGPFFALGPTLTWNLFDREAIYARIRAADAGAAAALTRYQATVTTALEEVDSAMNGWQHERARRAQLDEARAASLQASELARLRYREGIEDFLTVLDAERNQLEIEDQLAQSEIALAQFMIDIHLALGGGWEAE